MKIKEGFVKKEIAGQNVVIALGEASKIFNGIIKLNETGGFIWGMLESGCDRDQIVQAMLDEYDVDRATAENDFDRFTDTLKGAGIIE